ncbi:endonuclease/exonuclease/phosphatase family protein [Nesterenkonia alkaliphila]|uniref:Endonuclease/exonuclease/phosphatase domain-containing protein n=1 Tax=Nesterenkonia alkaliphila TaxID=1463631 RepID=A0A7K1UIP9_9MICC|nr:endonuclease/exonuclease/phosphatase family protein [Nesterenkonia alkaliphila]MVT26353.1 hypothetical protein [Nesterenkonia alkaliphila]GFZ88570.1 endonuclease [Nesterenkonia alkaliphila]
MPTGSDMPARRIRKREALRPAAAVLLAACLSLAAVPPAQSGTAEGVAGAIPSPLYPAPGQPSQEANGDQDDAATSVVTKEKGDLRVATLHAGITADPDAEAPVQSLVNSLATGNHSQARAVAQTAQLNEPDVLILTGVSYDEDQQIAEQLSGYLASGQYSAAGLDYPYVFTAPTNSGRESGVDLDGDGSIGGPGDAVGYGEYPGQYGTVIFSKHPIVEDEVRTFQQFLWSDVPEAGMPQGYSDLEASVLRLSETTLWDVPVEVEGHRVNLVTTAVTDQNGAEDTARGDDLRQVISDYVSGQAWYLYDDEGETAAGQTAAHYVVAGVPAAKTGSENLDVLLDSAVLQDPQPEAVTERPLSDRPGSVWHTDPLATRYVPGDRDLRASYVLPSTSLQVNNSGVFWPGEGELGYQVVNPEGAYALTDRLVWVDLTLGG